MLFTQNYSNSQFKSNVRETWRVILVSKADIFVAAHSFRTHQRDFADASHFKSAKYAIDTILYGIFSSENSYLQLKERQPTFTAGQTLFSITAQLIHCHGKIH